MSIASAGASPGRETVGSAWLLDQHALDLRPLHLPATEARITWAHPIELDDPTPYLRGGELVLTTGLRMARAADGQAAYVERLVASGVAGLGFGTGLRHLDVPPAVLTACADRDLLLLEVPLHTPFIAVAQSVADRLGELRRLRLVETLDSQRALTRRALRDGVGGVVATLARQLHAAVYVADRGRREVARAGAASGLRRRMEAELDAGRRGAFSDSGPHGWFEIQVLGERPAAGLGWLVVARPEPPLVAERPVLMHAVSMVALLLDRSDRSRQPAAEDALVQVLLDGMVGDLGVRVGLEEPVAVVVASGDRLRMSGAIPEVRALHRGRMLVSEREDTVLLVRADQARSVALHLVALAGQGARAGTGPGLSLSECRRSLQAARAAHAAASAGDVVDAVDIPVWGFLQKPEVRDAVSSATAETFRKLHEAEDHDELVRSLRAFLDHHGGWERAARELGIHRHTLRHRMSRVEDLTGLSLDQPQERLALHLGLMVTASDGLSGVPYLERSAL
jgi:PucR family transcriptional regulator, purine catabolism regulatory protein